MATTEQLLQEVMSELRTVLRAEVFQFAMEELAAGEQGIAFEAVCDQLHEYDLRIPEAAYAKLRDIGESMNLPAETWEILIPLVN